VAGLAGRAGGQDIRCIGDASVIGGFGVTSGFW
jgi:hypothetical protein